MKVIGRYDSHLQMFVEDTREPDLRRLKFLRWLVEQDRLEHPVAGPSAGALAGDAVDSDAYELAFAS